MVLFTWAFLDATRAFLDVTANFKSMDPWAVFTSKLSFMFYLPGLRLHSSATRLRTLSYHPIIPLTMNYIMNFKTKYVWVSMYSGNSIIHIHSVLQMALQTTLLTRTFARLAPFDFSRFSVASSSVAFFNKFNSRISSCASSTCGGALSQNPIIPYTMDSWNTSWLLEIYI